nr:uncharacterized protein CI109_004955 [Kwoniella shandongensis]KAA5526752.1 hypothetical protein CI109_004955 [Kwoniella shandongensis]
MESDPSSSTAGGAATGSKITRNRPFLSCTECVRRKVKCDRTQPCTACKTRNKPEGCQFPPTPERSHGRRSISSRPSGSLQSTTPEILQTPNGRKRQRVSSSANAAGAKHGPISSPAPTTRQSPVKSPPRRGRVERDQTGTTTWYISSTQEHDAQHTEPAVQDMEDYLTAGAMSAKWNLAQTQTEAILEAEQELEESSRDQGSPSSRHHLSCAAVSAETIKRITSQSCEPSHRTIFKEVLATLPIRRETIHYLVARYFSHVAWHWHILHRPSFIQEYDAFSLLCERGQSAQVDPLWLASLFAILCLAANSFDEVDALTNEFVRTEELIEMPSLFYRAACSSLECGDWLGKARIRSVQALGLIESHLLFNASPDCVGRLGKHSICAIRLCQELGIHTLSDDPTKMPPYDPALPSQPSLLRRELHLRLFYNVLTLDLLQHRHRPSMSLSDVTCGLPENFDDDHLDLYSEEMLKPAATLTDTAFDILRFETARMQREWLEVVRRDTVPKDEVILDLDKRMIALHRRYMLESQHLSESRQKMWSRLIAVYNLHVRRLRFIRPFMRPQDHSTSQERLHYALHTAARSLISAGLELHRSGAPLVRGSFFLLHLQSAVVVLVQDMWFHQGTAEARLDDELIFNVLLCFEQYTKSIRPQIQRAARIGSRTIKLLIDTVHDRRMFAGSNESFVYALKRISNTVKKDERRDVRLVNGRSGNGTTHSPKRTGDVGNGSGNESSISGDPDLDAWIFSFMNISAEA